jgi:hypothetical protein
MSMDILKGCLTQNLALGVGSSSYYVASFAHLTLNDHPIDLFTQDGKAPALAASIPRQYPMPWDRSRNVQFTMWGQN